MKSCRKSAHLLPLCFFPRLVRKVSDTRHHVASSTCIVEVPPMSCGARESKMRNNRTRESTRFFFFLVPSRNSLVIAKSVCEAGIWCPENAGTKEQTLPQNFETLHWSTSGKGQMFSEATLRPITGSGAGAELVETVLAHCCCK